MAIENRELAVGTRLVARHKKQAFVCTVEGGEDGKRAYVLEDGRRFTSPSAAASAVMGGIAANGWRFWSVEGSEPAAAPSAGKAQKEKAPAKTKAEKKSEGTKKPRRQKEHGHGGANGRHPLLHPASKQVGVAEGMVGWVCDACLDVFIVAGGEVPAQCPAGHRADAPEFDGDAPRVDALDLEPDLEPVA